MEKLKPATLGITCGRAFEVDVICIMKIICIILVMVFWGGSKARPQAIQECIMWNKSMAS
jgi:hypothetical protein